MLRLRTYNGRLKFFLFSGLVLVSIVIFVTGHKQFQSMITSEKDLVSLFSSQSTPITPENTAVHLDTTFTPPKIIPKTHLIEQYSLQVNPDLFNYTYITPRDPTEEEIAAVEKERQEIESRRCHFLKPYKYYHQVNWQNVSNKNDLVIPRYDNKYTIKPLVIEGRPRYNPANKYQRVTIVTQLTIDRLPTLLFLMNGRNRAWPGRVSATIFFENENVCNEVIAQIQQNWPQEVLDRLDLHAVISHITVRTYPINFLRNIALNYVKTDFVFYLDVDFIPSENFLDKVPDALWNSLDTGIVWVSVAFHNNCTVNHTITPSTLGTIPEWFYGCARSHPTLPDHPSQEANYVDFWYSATEPYRVPYRPYFEPYIIGPRTLPPYDENFFYGADKVSHIYEVSAAGYSFVVMPDVYVEHFPHGSYSSESKKMKYTANPPKKFCEVVNRVRCQYHFDTICTSEDVRKRNDDGFQRLRKHFKNSCGCGELYLPNS